LLIRYINITLDVVGLLRLNWYKNVLVSSACGNNLLVFSGGHIRRLVNIYPCAG